METQPLNPTNLRTSETGWQPKIGVSMVWNHRQLVSSQSSANMRGWNLGMRFLSSPQRRLRSRRWSWNTWGTLKMCLNSSTTSNTLPLIKRTQVPVWMGQEKQTNFVYQESCRENPSGRWPCLHMRSGWEKLQRASASREDQRLIVMGPY